MSRTKFSLKLIAVCGLVILDFLGACAAFWWKHPSSATDAYLYRMAHAPARPFPVPAVLPGPDWVLSTEAYINRNSVHDWSIHVGGGAVGLVQWENSSWSVLLGRGGHMVHFISPIFLLFTAALIAVGVLMFRRRTA